MINTDKVWNVSTEEKVPLLSAKRNKHHFHTLPSIHIYLQDLASSCCMIQDYPQTSYFSCFSKWMLQNQPGKNKRIKQPSQSLQNIHPPGDVLLASLCSSASRFCSLLVWLQLCTTAPQLRKRSSRYSQLLGFHWDLIGKILQGSPIYTVNIMYMRC